MNYSITTKKGDQGKTTLLDHSVIEKSDLRPESYGALDEATAFIGLARSFCSQQNVIDILRGMQNHIYLINAELACPVDRLHLLKHMLQKSHLEQLEGWEKQIEQDLELPRKFVLYGECKSAAYLDVARAVMRRAERRTVILHHSTDLQNETILPYLNRASDILFLLARYEEFKQNIPYAHPDVV